MKKFLALAVVLASASAFSAPARSINANTTGRSFYLGSAIDSFSTGSTTPAFTGLLILSDRTALQMYLSMPQVSPAFQIGGGANIKYALTGNVVKGIHFGAGLGIGSTGSFFVNVGPLLGIHFELIEGVMINLDSGLGLYLQPSGTTQVDVKLGGFSGNFGASIMMAL